MKCKLCNSTNITLLGELKPYFEKNWIYDIFECRGCQTRFTEIKDSKNHHEKFYAEENNRYSFYNDIASKVNKYIKSGEIKACEKYLNQKSKKYEIIINHIKRYANKNSKILEIGSSTGFLVAFLRQIGYNVTGVDISKTAVEKAKNKFGNYYSTKYNNEKYDIIYHNGLIGCVDNPNKFLLEQIKMLNKGGRIIFNSPNLNSPKEFKELWVGTPPPDLRFIFSEKSYTFLKKHCTNYNIKYYKSYKEIFDKNKKILLKRKNQTYPKRFYVEKHIETKTKKIIVKVGLMITKIALRLGIFKNYSGEYNMIVDIKK